MAKSDNGIGCCGHHLECQLLGKCVSDLLGKEFPRCSLKERVIDYPFPTLYKLKELGLIDVEHNNITQKGIDTLQKYIGDMPDPYVVLLLCMVGGLDGHYNHPRDTKVKLFKMKELLKHEKKTMV